MKKIIFIVLAIVIIILLIFIKDITQFTMEYDEKQIEKGIESFISRGDDSPKDIEVKKIRDVENEKLVLFELKDNIGAAFLIKGVNGKFKVKSVGYGNSSYRLYIRKIKNEKYLIIFYRNKDLNVKKIKATVEKEEFNFQIENEVYGILYTPVETKLDDGSRPRILFFDKHGSEITNEIL